MNLGNWLAEQARHAPDRPALYVGRELVADYGSFHDRSARVSAWLRAQGVRAGDRVAIFLKNCPDYLIVQYGVWYAGAVAVPINAKLPGREAAFVLEDAGATICFVSTDQHDALLKSKVTCRMVDVFGDEYQ